ncbi:DUF2384 domain-containing protein [Sphingomonas sp. ID1715]|uniref:MbcA/ParS/Xre antitoxin family protein n=1 Tax=Sphingomonas sp. ID1715 TaxID=1656898 RepID=UPI00148854F8|nr:MbcA/ParS/Xre antitoxin family protein [Sphingomonas sp. ID1715]NNM76512.1 DUF2384 domain-containing protein [Sphingomonas sp. ID1715]
MSPSEEEKDRLALERWIADQSAPPTLWDVLETRDPRLIAAWITPIFRRAAAEAVEETTRVERVRGFVREAYGGDSVKAEEFLRRGHPALDGDTPLQRAVQSEAGADEVVQLVGRALYGGGF